MAKTLAILSPKAANSLVQAYEAASELGPYEEVLILMQGPAAKVLAKGLPKIEGQKRDKRLQLLSRFEGKETALALIPLLEDSRLAPEVMPVLIVFRGDSLAAFEDHLNQGKVNPAVKAAMARILGKIGLKQAAPLLEDLAKDPSPQVRSAADKALAQIRGF